MVSATPPIASTLPDSSPGADSPAPLPPALTGPVTRRHKGIFQPKILTDGTVASSVASSSILAEHAASKDTTEPRDYKEALSIPHRRAAMETEFSALQANGTWNLVPPINLIDSKWVFKVKLHADCSVEHFGVRLTSNDLSCTYLL
jgi:hypothetical protein